MTEIIANKNLWTHLHFDEDNIVDYSSDLSFTNEKYSIVKRGYIPDDISSRYLAYFENDCLYIHSLMGGACYLELYFSQKADKVFIARIRKYRQYNPHHSEKETIDFIKSFFRYSLQIEI